jgi:hypothetical protein
MSRAGPVPGTDRTVVSDETTLGPVLSVSGTGKMTRTADTVSAVRGRGGVRSPSQPGRRQKNATFLAG